MPVEWKRVPTAADVAEAPDDEVVLKALTFALALQMAGRPVSLASVVELARDRFPLTLIGAEISERLPGLASDFEASLEFAASLAETLSAQT